MKAGGLEKQEKYTREIGSTSSPNEECNKDGGEKRDKMLTQMVSWILPQDIASDILSRLPTKSVMRCRCVCKAWCALLKNPDFIDMHLFQPSQAKTPSLVLVTIDLTRDDSSTDTLPVINMDYNAYLIEHMLELRVMSQPVVPLQIPAHSICASCNGLLCLSSFGSSTDTTTWICNPFTRETVPLPRFSTSLETVNGICGFGYHPRTKEYKVLWFGHVCRPGRRPSPAAKVMAQVHTLGSTSWRSKGEIPFRLLWRPFNVLVDGALHWLAGYPRGSKKVAIISFDIGDEEFRVLSIPPPLLLVDKWQYKHVQELGGFLSFVDISSRNSVDIWIMKQYGVEESWNKQFVVPIPGMLDSVSLLWHVMGGEILLHYNSNEFVAYDPNNDQVRHLAVQVPLDLEIHRSFVHRGSLVSPKLGVLKEKTS